MHIKRLYSVYNLMYNIIYLLTCAVVLFFKNFGNNFFKKSFDNEKNYTYHITSMVKCRHACSTYTYNLTYKCIYLT